MFAVALNVIINCSTTSAEEKPEGKNIFSVLLRQMEGRSINAYIEVSFQAYPENVSEIDVVIEQWQNWAHDFERFKLYPSREDLQHSYTGNVTTSFHPVGAPELYPYDSYMLNVTFKLWVPISVINENNSWFDLQCLEPGIYVSREAGQQQDKFSAVISDQTRTYLNSRIYLYRGFSSADLIVSVLVIVYALMGSLPMIKPDKLENRLSVCLSLFIFAVTFTFTISGRAPRLSQPTLAETLTFLLLIGAGLFSIASVIEKALIEARSEVGLSQYFVEGFAVTLLIVLVNLVLVSFMSLTRQYPWMYLSPVIPVFFSIALLYGYAFKTVPVLWKNRSKISERLRAVHIFHR